MKDNNNDYYDSCSSILRDLFIQAKNDLLKTRIPGVSQSRFEEKSRVGVQGMVSVVVTE